MEANFLCNESYMVDHSIVDEWLEWMKNERIPAVLKKARFAGYRFVRLMDIDETEGKTFSLQLEIISRAEYLRYLQLILPELNKKAFDKWGNKFVGFRTFMEIL